MGEQMSFRDHRVLGCFLLVLAALAHAVAGCAEGSVIEDAAVTSGPGAGGGASSSAATGNGGSGGGRRAQACPEGEFLSGFDATGTVICTRVEELARSAINGGCAVYYGWQDNCAAC